MKDLDWCCLFTEWLIKVSAPTRVLCYDADDDNANDNNDES